MTAKIPQEAVERMVALVRGMAVGDPRIAACPHCTEARAIVAMLPEPVDPDLPEVREDLALFYENENAKRVWPDSGFQETMIADVRAGRLDHTPPIRFGLIAFKRGRELALKARDGE